MVKPLSLRILKSITPLIIVCLQNPASDLSAKVIEEKVEAFEKETHWRSQRDLSLHFKQVKEAVCDIEAYQKVGNESWLLLSWLDYLC